jgi:phospholipase C
MRVKLAVWAACCLAALPAASAVRADDLSFGGPSTDAIAAQMLPRDTAPPLSHDRKLALLRQHIKYVFVLFQENRAFDFHFGSFPGADGLFSPGAKPGFKQPIVNTDGSVGSISPFLIPQTVQDASGHAVPLYPADTASVDHSHIGIDNSMHVSGLVAANDRYALNEEKLTTDEAGHIVSRATGAPLSALAPPTLIAKQMGELVMAHIDCDTIPLLWSLADRFTLMDNFHQTEIAASTPNAIAMIAGESGETQWALHPEQGSNNRGNPAVVASGGEPMVADPGPFPGSDLDHSPSKPPYNAADSNPARPALNQTYASLPLSFMGPRIAAIVAADPNPAMDLLDVQDDVNTIASANPMTVPWGWYQQGYDREPTDGSDRASHSGYVVHHNGPQYFGYLGDNKQVQDDSLHGLGDFFADIEAGRLPDRGGVFYVRGGYGNIAGLKPLDPNPAVQKDFPGNDDHPAYSDAHISESLIAQEVNAIAASRYWGESAIIYTYDETDGLYDHVQPRIRSWDPEGRPLAGGPRIPAVVMSPFSVAHAIDHQYSEHGSVIRFIDELFSLVKLGDLPDEARGRALGETEFHQPQLGPSDIVAGMGDLFSAFDDRRLQGTAAPLPAAYAMTPDEQLTAIPPYGGHGCAAIHMTPTDYRDGKPIDPPPSDFNPRPASTPGIPSSGHWTP